MLKSIAADSTARRLALSTMVVMAVVLVSFCLSGQSEAEVGDTFYSEGVQYKIVAEPSESGTGTVSVIGFDSDAEQDIEITGQTEFENKPYTIVSVEAYALSKCDHLVSLNLIGDVEIGDDAFANCSALKAAFIPDVTELGKGAFLRCSSLTMMDLDAVTSIGENAFAECYGLETVAFGKELDHVEDNPFLDCTSLSAMFGLNVMDGVCLVVHGKAVSYAIASEKTSLTLPESIEAVGNSAFYGAGNLETANLESVVSLESYAFGMCSNLASVTVSQSLANIGSNPFFGCVLLAEFGGDHPGIIDDGRMLVSGSKLVSYAIGSGTSSIVIPDGIEEVAGSSFSRCESLQHLDLGKVVAIEDGAFEDCENILDIKFPDTLASLGIFSFSLFFDRDVSVENMKGNIFMFDGKETMRLAYEITWNDYDGSLIETTLVKAGTFPEHEAPEAPSGFVFAGWDPAPVTAAGDAVYTAKAVDSSTMYSVQVVRTGDDGSVSKSTFKLLVGSEIKSDGLSLKVGKYSMRTTIPDDTDCYSYDFSGWLIDGRPIPEGGTTVMGDTVITGTTVAETKRYVIDLVVQGSGSVSKDTLFLPYGTLMYTEGNTLHAGDTEVVATPMEASGDYIYRFSGWGLDSVQVKKNMTVTAVFEDVWIYFYYDQLMYKIVSDTEVEVVDYEDGLVTATIPGSVSYKGTDYAPIGIGETALAYCPTLTSIEIGPCVRYIEYSSLVCPRLVSISVDEDSSYYSSVGGVLYDKTGEVLVKFPNAKQRIVIPDSVKKIGEYAFYATGYGVRDVGGTPFTYASLPASVEEIGYGAFYGSTVETLKLNGDGTVIDEYAFGRCDGLSYVIFPKNMSSWNTSDSAFYGCVFHDEDGNEVEFDADSMSGKKYTGEGNQDLKLYVPPAGGTIRMDDLVYRITDSQNKEVVLIGAEESASGRITIEDRIDYLGFDWNVTSIASKAFAGNDRITGVLCKADVGYRAFWKCTALQSVTLECESIGNYAFASCTSLKEVVVSLDGRGRLLANIGDSAFSGCTSLSRMDVSTATTIGDKAFFHCALKSINLRSAESIGGWAFNGNALERIEFGLNLTDVDPHAFGGYTLLDAEGSRVSVSAEGLLGKLFMGSDKVLQEVI
jgi:hypothetical protein